MSNEPSLDRIKAWRDDYRAVLAPTPLEDINQLTAQLDLTHAHPSGIAKLFASGQATLDVLFRDAGMLRAAERRLGRVVDDRDAKRRVSGVAGLSLAVGVATWTGNAMPVLLYPVEVTTDAKEPAASVVRFTGRVSMNATFLDTMAMAGVELDEQELFDGKNYESGVPDTSAVFAAITAIAGKRIAGFSIERHIALGCFMEPSALVLTESQRIIDRLASGPTGNTLLDALSGDEQACAALRDDPILGYSPFDADPHTEVEVCDVDNTVRYAAQLAAAGHNVFLDTAVGSDTAAQAAAIAARCVMAGRSVLVVPGVAEQKRRFAQTMRANEMGGQLLDIAESNVDEDIDRQLIAAVGFQPGVAVQRFDQLADELVGVRSRLTRYLGDLHGVNEQWGVSAYQTIQNLASISASPTHPATRVRLDVAAARRIGGHIDEWTAKLVRAGELGEYVIGPNDTAWYKASITSEDDAVAVYQRVVDLLEKLLPAVREHVASVAETCGFPVPATAREWGRQITVLKNLRRVLDVFQPEIFERDIESMIEASKSKADRKAEGTTLGFWERRRLVREAKGLLRVGAQVEDLHDALIVVRKQAEQWGSLVPHGGWPVLPSKLDRMVETQEALSSDLTALDAVLATTPQGADLESLDFTKLESRLHALYDDRIALDTLPERCRLENEFTTAGLDELIGDLGNRRVDTDAVGAELQLAWWTTVFEDIVRSSPIISNQDGSALEAASDRFEQVDVEHVRSIGPMVAQDATRRLCDMLFSRTQEANQLHTALAGRGHMPLDRLRRDHPDIITAAKPVMMATPATLCALTAPETLADVVIIDACAHIPAIQLLGIVARARKAVVIAHGATVTCESLQMLIGMLPRVEAAVDPVCRAPQVADFLEANGYGPVRHDVANETTRGEVRFHRIEASGVPTIGSGLVESSQQEIEEVVRLITERASRFTIVPAQYLLAVVTLTDAFRARLGAELKALAAKDATMDAFLRHVRLVGVREVPGIKVTDVILTLCYAKTSHGRLIQQFGPLEDGGGRGVLLDAMALPDRHLDIVSAFGSEDLDDSRLHQPGPRLLKTMLMWAEQLGDRPEEPAASETSGNVLMDDLAARIRARGLEVAVDYGYERGMRIPLAVGVKGKPYRVAVLTDDQNFMSIQSTRVRHRLLMQQLMTLGWSVMTVWSVGAFVNPDKEVDRIVSRLGELYRDVQ
ncbi:helicase [Bifidobacterium pullorum subsp. saeculare]|uniref:Helicase n=1 Tax=Bifidobacterium pullorum subsp. saeculare TaxID=78257 RepID=A0A938WW66_9BIFI|nr:helicase [Bifidobacterium pullorum]MBM6700015.1 helicase [Bifidobacterium pullorum subsp. saeculare]